MPTLTSRCTIAGLAAPGALLLALLVAAPSVDAATIYACQKKKGGAIRTVTKEDEVQEGRDKADAEEEGNERHQRRDRRWRSERSGRGQRK